MRGKGLKEVRLWPGRDKQWMLGKKYEIYFISYRQCEASHWAIGCLCVCVVGWWGACGRWTIEQGSNYEWVGWGGEDNPSMRYFFKDFIYFLEGKGGKKRGREAPICGCLLHVPHWGPGLQPRHVPWLGIEPAILWFADWHSTHWATHARAFHKILYWPKHRASINNRMEKLFKLACKRI